MNSSSSPEGPEDVSPKRRAFMQCLERDKVIEKARPHYVRWAEQWTKARGHESEERTKAYFDALGPWLLMIEVRLRSISRATPGQANVM